MGLEKRMTEREIKEPGRGTVNLLLVSISLVIFGSRGLLLVTQMEIVPGW